MSKISIQIVADQMKASLALLEQLHVLSQTQTLLLENGDLANMGALVEKKESIVLKITEAERRMNALLAEGDPAWSRVQELVALKERAIDLIEKISAVECTNRELLDSVRADLLQKSQTLRQDRKIRETYGQFS